MESREDPAEEIETWALAPTIGVARTVVNPGPFKGEGY
jgi:hypothetical protein